MLQHSQLCSHRKNQQTVENWFLDHQCELFLPITNLLELLPLSGDIYRADLKE